MGAPYGGSEGEGIVYVYRGSKVGVREKADQVIAGRDVRSNIRQGDI